MTTKCPDVQAVTHLPPTPPFVVCVCTGLPNRAGLAKRTGCKFIVRARHPFFCWLDRRFFCKLEWRVLSALSVRLAYSGIIIWCSFSCGREAEKLESFCFPRWLRLYFLFFVGRAKPFLLGLFRCREYGLTVLCVRARSGKSQPVAFTCHHGRKCKKTKRLFTLASPGGKNARVFGCTKHERSKHATRAVGVLPFPSCIASVFFLSYFFSFPAARGVKNVF